MRTALSWKSFRCSSAGESRTIVRKPEKIASKVAHSPSTGIGFADRGARALRGVPGRWRLYAVSEADAA